MISSQPSLTDAYLRTPKAAAFAGIIFSVLWVAVFGFMRLSVPSDPFEEGAWLAGDTRYVAFAMNLVPFAGIAFLWFVGVLRDRLGAREDIFRDGVLGQRIFTAGHAVRCRRSRWRDHSRISCGTRRARPLRYFSFRTRLGLWDDQHLLVKDSGGLHDHDVDHCHLHGSDAALARDRGIRHRGRTPDWKFLFRLEPARVSVVGFVG
jgi:hypothetical protein